MLKKYKTSLYSSVSSLISGKARATSFSNRSHNYSLFLVLPHLYVFIRIWPLLHQMQLYAKGEMANVLI